MYELKTLELTQAEIDATAALLRIAFPKATQYTADYLHWMYCRNPHGNAVGFNAYLSGELAAHYVTIPIEARLFGKVEKGLLSLNTCTHPAHQGKGLFTQLALKTYEVGKSAGYGFVVGVANQNSTHGFVKKLGFQLVSPLDAKVGFGKVPQNEPDELMFDQTWNADYVLWRSANPAASYRVQKAVGARTLILSATAVPGVSALLADVADHLLENVQRLRTANPVLPRVWIGLDPAVDWTQAAYVDIPTKLRPSPLNFIFKDLTGSSRQLEKGRVRYWGFNFDAY